MLTGFSQPFVQGQCVEMTLHFAKAGDLKVELNIGSFSQSAPPAGDGGVSVKPSGEPDMSSMAMPM
jgi:copper(I)-binding protein